MPHLDYVHNMSQVILILHMLLAVLMGSHLEYVRLCRIAIMYVFYRILNMYILLVALKRHNIRLIDRVHVNSVCCCIAHSVWQRPIKLSNNASRAPD